MCDVIFCNTPVQSIERVYSVHRLDLLRLATLLTGSREHGEDVVQSVFASAHPRWDSITQQLPYCGARSSTPQQMSTGAEPATASTGPNRRP